MKKQTEVYNIRDLRNLIDRCKSRGVLEELPPIYARVLARFERGESLSDNSLIMLRTKLKQLLEEVKN